MDIKRNSRHRGSISRLVCSLLVLALAVGLIIVSPGAGRKVKAVEFGKPCSITVEPGGEGLLEDLKDADIVIDIYEVAKAVDAGNGQDTYDFEFLEGYTQLGEALSKDLTSKDWKKMAQTAAAYALDSGVPVTSGKLSENKTFGNLECGLYLIIARGSGIDDYTTTVTDEENNQNIATIAHSEKYTYSFLPELISLPSKKGYDESGNPVNTTAGNGDWVYNMNVTLKPQQRPHLGSLEIVKNLTTYNVNDPAVFVFQVEAKVGNDTVYSDVVTLIFTEAGEKKALLEKKIPVGADVTVTEVYSGASYKITSDDVQKTTILNATDVASVTFRNDHDTTTHGGGGVNNHFTYDYSGGRWKWQSEQQPASRAAGE